MAKYMLFSICLLSLIAASASLYGDKIKLGGAKEQSEQNSAILEKEVNKEAAKRDKTYDDCRAKNEAEKKAKRQSELAEALALVNQAGEAMTTFLKSLPAPTTSSSGGSDMCYFIEDSNRKSLCYGDCYLIEDDDDLKAACLGQTYLIEHKDLRHARAGECDLVDDTEMRYICLGDCYMVDNSDLRHACLSGIRAIY